jgi:hypothetical protein
MGLSIRIRTPRTLTMGDPHIDVVSWVIAGVIVAACVALFIYVLTR